MKDNVIAEKSLAFAFMVIDIYKFLATEKKEFVLSKQFLKSGTAIGAMVREAEHAESKVDFLHKMNIALKEANETGYWLLLLREGRYLDGEKYDAVQENCAELIRLLASIVKTTKTNIGR